uniref:Uncharacterized protein n=1 Tax=Sexangularia sp. CB-2014 TaxID=1486929 RepID=A0A7S1YDD8_9EUKA
MSLELILILYKNLIEVLPTLDLPQLATIDEILHTTVPQEQDETETTAEHSTGDEAENEMKNGEEDWENVKDVYDSVGTVGEGRRYELRHLQQCLRLQKQQKESQFLTKASDAITQWAQAAVTREDGRGDLGSADRLDVSLFLTGCATSAFVPLVVDSWRAAVSSGLADLFGEGKALCRADRPGWPAEAAFHWTKRALTSLPLSHALAPSHNSTVEPAHQGDPATPPVTLSLPARLVAETQEALITFYTSQSSLSSSPLILATALLDVEASMCQPLSPALPDTTALPRELLHLTMDAVDGWLEAEAKLAVDRSVWGDRSPDDETPANGEPDITDWLQPREGTVLPPRAHSTTLALSASLSRTATIPNPSVRQTYLRCVVVPVAVQFRVDCAAVDGLSTSLHSTTTLAAFVSLISAVHAVEQVVNDWSTDLEVVEAGGTEDLSRVARSLADQRTSLLRRLVTAAQSSSSSLPLATVTHVVQRDLPTELATAILADISLDGGRGTAADEAT